MLDVFASMKDNGRRLTLTLINKALSTASEVELPSWLQSWRIAKADTIAPPDVRSLNSFAEPQIVSDRPLSTTSDRIHLAQHSISRLMFVNEG